MVEGRVTSTCEKRSSAQASAEGEEREPVEPDQGVRGQGSHPRLPSCIFQRAPLSSAENR